MITVITSVRQYTASFYIYMFQQGDCVCDIISLSFTDHQTNWITIRVYNSVDFGAGSTPAMSDFVWRPLFCTGAVLMRLDNGTV